MNPSLAFSWDTVGWCLSLDDLGLAKSLHGGGAPEHVLALSFPRKNHRSSSGSYNSFSWWFSVIMPLMTLKGCPCILYTSNSWVLELLKLFKSHSYTLSLSSAKRSYFTLFLSFHSTVAQKEKAHWALRRFTRGCPGSGLEKWWEDSAAPSEAAHRGDSA